jgi:membrane-bound ClpP family serine protease
LRITYSIIFSIAIYYIFQNSGELNKDVFIKNYLTFQFYWSLGLIVFGCHLVIVGILMKGQKSVQSALWLLIIIVGAAYIIIHLLNSLLPQFKNLISILNSIFGIPMALAELSLALWLILKGGRAISNSEVKTLDKSELFWNRVAKRTSNTNQKSNDKTVKDTEHFKNYFKAY